MKNRQLFSQIKDKQNHRHGRLISICGARQTGKTTLCRQVAKDFAYITMDDPILRNEYLKLTANDWVEKYPKVIIDEIQKAPQLFDTIKAVYDKGLDTRIILTGSAQILLLKNIKETLAGRCLNFELYPLTLTEKYTDSWEENIKLSIMQQFFLDFNFNNFKENPLLQNEYAKKKILFEDYTYNGGMPEMTHDDLTQSDKDTWLYQYCLTYLQRDLMDIAEIKDLNSFINAQIFLANNTGQLINFSTIAKIAGVSSMTAKKFSTYLGISYQTITLQPWFRNLNKRLVKTPKIHFLDPGIQRSILRRKGEINGNEYESAVVAEIFKQLKNIGLNVSFFHLRTLDGREIDLVLEFETGYVLIEIKKAQKVKSEDLRHLKNIEDVFDKPILGSFLLSEDNNVQSFGEKIFAIPAAWFLS